MSLVTLVFLVDNKNEGLFPKASSSLKVNLGNQPQMMAAIGTKVQKFRTTRFQLRLSV